MSAAIPSESACPKAEESRAAGMARRLAQLCQLRYHSRAPLSYDPALGAEDLMEQLEREGDSAHPLPLALSGESPSEMTAVFLDACRQAAESSGRELSVNPEPFEPLDARALAVLIVDFQLAPDASLDDFSAAGALWAPRIASLARAGQAALFFPRFGSDPAPARLLAQEICSSEAFLDTRLPFLFAAVGGAPGFDVATSISPQWPRFALNSGPEPRPPTP